MTLPPALEWLAFGAFALIGVAGALGMATTMSMFRSGVFLMASFVGVAGLFILLSADLLSLLQIMMYIGGMLVMILFMVLFSHDPGGSMMAGSMPLKGAEKFFSLGLAGGAEPDDGGGMDMGGMSMTTPLKRHAAVLALAAGLLLAALLLLRPAWPIAAARPDPNSARAVGLLLMGKYMIAFEGAGLLILLGIFGAVFISRPGRFPDTPGRDRPVKVDGPPAPIVERPLVPRSAPPAGDAGGIVAAHRDGPGGRG